MLLRLSLHQTSAFSWSPVIRTVRLARQGLWRSSGGEYQRRTRKLMCEALAGPFSEFISPHVLLATALYLSSNCLCSLSEFPSSSRRRFQIPCSTYSLYSLCVDISSHSFFPTRLMLRAWARISHMYPGMAGGGLGINASLARRGIGHTPD